MQTLTTAPTRVPTPTQAARLTPTRWSRTARATTAAIAGALLLAATGAGAGVALAQAAAPAQTRTTLAVTADRSGAQTVFSAHVTGETGSAISAGTVSFDTPSASLGAMPLNPNGDATLAVTSLPAATGGLPPQVRAVFHPSVAAQDAPLAASVSSAETVQPAASGPPDFVATANPASLSTAQGGSATTAITITPTGGFAEQVTLSCANVPATAICVFSPVINSTASGAFTSVLQIQTQAASGPVSALSMPRGGPPALAWALPGVLALLSFPALRRRTFRGVAAARSLAALLLLVSAAAGLGGCSTRYGYNHHPPSVAPGTPTGTYQLNIDASGNDGSAVTSHTVTVTLQVT